MTRPLWISLLLLLLVARGAGGQTPGAPVESAEDAFRRSLSDNLENAATPRQFLALGVGALALIIALVVVTRWRTRVGPPGAPRQVKSPAKLLRDVSKRVHLKSAEVRQLKLLSQAQNVENPLVLLLCPSVLAQAVKQNPRRLDRGVLAGLARKITRRAP